MSVVDYLPILPAASRVSLSQQICLKLPAVLNKKKGEVVLGIRGLTAIDSSLTGAPQLALGSLPNQFIMSEKYCTSAMHLHLTHLTYRASELNLACLQHTQNTYLSLQLG
jgi:hypothetical protein